MRLVPASSPHTGHNPVGVEAHDTAPSQGSLADSATLGWRAQSLWDWPLRLGTTALRIAALLCLLPLLASTAAAAQMSVVYVDFCYTGTFSDGTLQYPYHTVTEGVANVESGGTVRVASGSYYQEPSYSFPIPEKPVTLETYNGPALIGPDTVPQSGDPKAKRPDLCRLWNTGVGANGLPLASGPDPHFGFRRPAGSTGTSVAVSPNAAWNNSPGASSWISTQSDRDGQGGDYYYTNYFSNCCSGSGSVIEGIWLADNGVELFIDGVSKASRPGTASANFQTWAPFTVTGLGPGPHTAVFKVNDDGVDTGLRVEWTNYCVCNYPPIAKAGRDKTVCASNCCAQVWLRGLGSYDPDGDALTYAWTDNGVPKAATRDAYVTLCNFGAHFLTLTVSDGHGHTASDTVVITLIDCTPPVVRCPPNIVTNCPYTLADLKSQVVASDDCPVSGPWPLTITQTPAPGAPFGDGVHHVVSTICDTGGNCQTCEMTVTVVETTVVPHLFNTGVDSADALLAGAATDSHYSLNGSGATFVISSHTQWTTPPPRPPDGGASKWIGPNTGDGNAVSGNYSYRQSFTLSCTNRVFIQGRWMADNMAYMTVNGQTAIGPGGTGIALPDNNWNGWRAFSIERGFAVGVNQLFFVVTNFGSYTGLRVEFTNVVVDCCPSNPCTPPVITLQPQSQTVTAFPVTLHGAAAGTGPPFYRWYRNGVALEDGAIYKGTVTDTLQILKWPDPGLSFSTTASGYQLRAWNDCGEVWSQPVALYQRYWLDLGPANPGFHWLIPTEFDVHYRVESSEGLNLGAVWSPLDEFDGDGQPREFTDPRPPSPARFYRLTREAQP